MAKGKGKAKKQPRSTFKTSKAKKVPASAAPVLKEGPVSWRFSYMDMEGAWSCEAIDAATILGVRKALLHYEKQPWTATAGSGSAGTQHKVSTSGICAEAQKRLKNLGRDDFDFIWGFRLTGKQRVWGIRIGDVCYILWWDPEHTVFPSAQ